MGRIKDDVIEMKNFEKFALLINEEKRSSMLRPLTDISVALEIDKSKLVNFASSSLVSSCKDVYVIPILTSVLYIREESKEIRSEVLLDTKANIDANSSGNSGGFGGGSYNSIDDIGYFVNRMVDNRRRIGGVSSVSSSTATISATALAASAG